VREGFVTKYLATVALTIATFVMMVATPTAETDFALVGATIIDGTGAKPVKNGVILIRDGRIAAVGAVGSVVIPANVRTVDVAGKYIIPGLMDANVHLFLDAEPENVIQYEGHYEDLIIEAAQVALKNGITTVFDTWGPRAALVNARNKINSGGAIGSRIFLGGNIIGFTGPLSNDFFPDSEKVFSKTLVDRIDQQWEQGVGRELLWMTPEEVRAKIRAYISSGSLDLIKYGSSGHVNEQFIAFSPEAQRAIVEEAHRAGLTAQAHSTSVESLRLEIEAGVDLLQHCDITGPEPIPPATLKTIAERKIPCAAMVVTNKQLEWATTHELRPGFADESKTRDLNDRNLIKTGAVLLLTTDAGLFGPASLTSPILGPVLKDVPDVSTRLQDAEYLWLQAVSERGMAPMNALQAATRNIAAAYGKASEIGTIEPGKRADLVVLNADPLEDARNYRNIHLVIKDGVSIDRDKLPTKRYLSE
jgi:imidazolonepropionase-like amidohydrolase